ncbi:MAG: hypothetical protein F4X54_06945 [Chloroflexi bacterium]|nr:hypothetical protein [Chloroflexota bacterium]MYB84454.1 hypothetical protein [Chloroflexota bacterium]
MRVRPTDSRRSRTNRPLYAYAYALSHDQPNPDTYRDAGPNPDCICRPYRDPYAHAISHTHCHPDGNPISHAHCDPDTHAISLVHRDPYTHAISLAVTLAYSYRRAAHPRGRCRTHRSGDRGSPGSLCRLR